MTKDESNRRILEQWTQYKLEPKHGKYLKIKVL